MDRKEMGEHPDSPDGVDDSLGSESDAESAGGSETENTDEFFEAQEEEAMPDGDSNADLHALLAFSKSRLEKTPQAPSPPTEANDDTEGEHVAEQAVTTDDENSEKIIAESPDDRRKTLDHGRDAADEKKMDDADDADDAAAPAPSEEQVAKDQAYYLELALRKGKEAEAQAKRDEDPAYLLELAEKKVKEAQAKALKDEEETGENVIKPAVAAQPTRSENSEIWALLNYSKMRVETGATPQVGGKKGGSKNGSARGDDMSVSSKLSKSSKRSLGSRSMTKTAPITVVGGPGDLKSPLGSPTEGEEAEKADVPFPDVTGDGDASVDGSVSMDGTKNSVANEEESDSGEDDDDDDDEEESSEEEEDELPDFLKGNDDEEQIDPEEAKALYEAAKFKAASILSVSEEKLTDVQMLQAIAIAEEAARKGDEKFSTKRSLFKLNEAKIEDLKSFLSLSFSPKQSEQKGSTRQTEEGEAVGWGIGRGRLMKKLGTVVQDFREKCDEIDDKKKQEREGQPTNTEMFSAAMVDLKNQIEEYEKIVTKTATGKP